jgi:hypothetical protein
VSRRRARPPMTSGPFNEAQVPKASGQKVRGRSAPCFPDFVQAKTPIIHGALRDQVDDAALRVGTTFDVALCRCQARMTGQLLNIAQAAAALDASLGSLGDESAPSAMAGCAFEAKLAIKGQEPDRQSFRRGGVRYLEILAARAGIAVRGMKCAQVLTRDRDFAGRRVALRWR